MSPGKTKEIYLNPPTSWWWAIEPLKNSEGLQIERNWEMKKKLRFCLTKRERKSHLNLVGALGRDQVEKPMKLNAVAKELDEV